MTMTTAAYFLRRKRVGSSRTNSESEHRVGATCLVCFSYVCIFLCCLQRLFLFIVLCEALFAFFFIETWCCSTNRPITVSFSAFCCVFHISVFAFLDIFIYEFRTTVLCFSPREYVCRSTFANHFVSRCRHDIHTRWKKTRKSRMGIASITIHDPKSDRNDASIENR